MKAVFLLLLILFSSLTHSYAREVLKYEPAIVSLTGTLTLEDFPGPPGYQNVKKGDRIERQWILNLPKPIKVVADAGDELFKTHDRVQRVQLICMTEKCWNLFERFKKDEAVTLVGTLFSAVTGHHRTDVLMTVDKEDVR